MGCLLEEVEAIPFLKVSLFCQVGGHRGHGHTALGDLGHSGRKMEIGQRPDRMRGERRDFVVVLGVVVCLSQWATLEHV